MGVKRRGRRELSSSISISILKALTTFAVFKALTALATIFEALAAFFALTTYKVFAISATITALIETRTIPAVEVAPLPWVVVRMKAREPEARLVDLRRSLTPKTLRLVPGVTGN
jgi:hypothetical protein